MPVPQLLQFGANVHHVNQKPDGGSALHEAVAHKHEAVVELLLRSGANPFVENCKVGVAAAGHSTPAGRPERRGEAVEAGCGRQGRLVSLPGVPGWQGVQRTPLFPVMDLPPTPHAHTHTPACVQGFTAMDIACSTRNVPLLRRLEQCAPYVGWLLMKVPQFGGFGSSWQRRWVVVSHRFPNPQVGGGGRLGVGRGGAVLGLLHWSPGRPHVVLMAVAGCQHGRRVIGALRDV